ncbi:MAG: radical SAM protein, partial [Gemmatimonadetes bacterium]|nr:radical SAM protein [Gemmatimonadota bacterium]NIR38953.1 radical SAM protein [Actinomycetota bacterium]NIX22741.1 radical SAM protein [Actinomycetota bacterium]
QARAALLKALAVDGPRIEAGLAEVLGLDERRVETALAALVGEGRIEREGDRVRLAGQAG